MSTSWEHFVYLFRAMSSPEKIALKNEPFIMPNWPLIHKCKSMYVCITCICMYVYVCIYVLSISRICT